MYIVLVCALMDMRAFLSVNVLILIDKYKFKKIDE